MTILKKETKDNNRVELTIRVEGSRVWMTGEAVTVFTGTVEI